MISYDLSLPPMIYHAPFQLGGLFVKQWSSEAQGKHLEKHRVPDNKLEVSLTLNVIYDRFPPHSGVLNGHNSVSSLIRLSGELEALGPIKLITISSVDA